MNWAVAGLIYAGVCAVVMTALAEAEAARLVAGNIALLLPPLALLYVLATRRRAWRGRQAVFWGAMGAWSLLWFAGGLGWAADELWLATPLPWFKWHIVLQLCGSALPLIALAAWPHRSAPEDTAVTVAIDVTVLVFLTGFLYWSLIIAPANNLSRRRWAAIARDHRSVVRLATVAGCCWRRRRRDAPDTVYRRLALGMALAFGILWRCRRGRCAATTAPDRRPTSAGCRLLLRGLGGCDAPPRRSRPSQPDAAAAAGVAAAAVRRAGRRPPSATARYLMPLGEPADTLRDIATACALVGVIGLVLVRLRIEQRLAEEANQRLRLLATACEQAGELIIIVGRDSRIEYANDAFCRATGHTREELDVIAPASLVAEESAAAIPLFNQSIKARKVTRLNATLARKDGSTFQVACVAAPIVDPNSRVTHFVASFGRDRRAAGGSSYAGERPSALGEPVSGVHEITNSRRSSVGSSWCSISISTPRTAATRARAL